ncbi:MAG: hypothetical protein ABSH34_22075 [Verrucomicrobiota bacterium]
MRIYSLCVLMAAAALSAPAEEFPLEFKTLKPEEVQTFPGAFFTVGRLKSVKPKGLKSEPKTACRQPFYGVLDEGSSNSFIFRVEESEDGSGYDRLLIDLNQNGDLTDDPVVQGTFKSVTNLSLPNSQFTTFWPIPVAPQRMIGSWRPVYLGELRVDTRDAGKGEDVYIELLRVYAAWYLETTVQLDGFKRRVAVFDTAAQMRLGNEWKLNARAGWYFDPGDSFLQDLDGSGRFERHPEGGGISAFGPLQYFGPRPYKVSLAPDRRSLRVERWTGPLAEVAVRPHGDQVRNLELAWEKSRGQWQLLDPPVLDGKFTVPPGDYRLSGCNVVATPAQGQPVMAGAFQQNIRKTVRFTAGRLNTFRCGPPLQVEVSAEKRKPQDWELQRKLVTPADPNVDSEFVLAIHGQIQGADQETYLAFRRGKDLKQEPPKPAFAVLDANGKPAGSGNLEYG